MSKGFTIIELVFTLAISSIIVFSVFSIPADLMRTDNKQSEILENAREISLLKQSIVNDLMQGEIVENNNIITIGKSNYEFTDVVKRNDVLITNNSYSYELGNDYIKIYNDNVNFKLTTKSSMGVKQ